MHHKKNLVSAIITTIFLLALGTTAYVEDYYHADIVALKTIENPSEGILIKEDESRIVFRPENPDTGLIFYPGGKVQFEAYAPLMEACAQKGILCVLVKMPANLAVLDMNAADGISSEFPEISNWYIGGHSLGGSMAASYVGAHVEEFKGLILLASYSTEDLKETGLRVLSVYGTEDKVLDAEKYVQNKDNLPQDFSECVIQGGSHAYFGVYGKQEGDGRATISNEEQIRQTAEAIDEFLRKSDIVD